MKKLQRTYTLSTVITAALFALGFGIGAGYVIGRDTTPVLPEITTPGGAGTPASKGGGAGDGDPIELGPDEDDLQAVLQEEQAEEAAMLQELLQEEQSKAEDLEAKVAELQRRLGEVKIAPDRRAAAKKAYDRILGLDGEDSDDALMEMLGKLGDLGEEEAAYFIEQYLANLGKEGSPKEREAALMLAFLSGGDRVANFLGDLLNDPGMPRADRMRLLLNIGNPREPIYSMDRIPMTGSLGQTAFGLLDSRRAVERRGGAALLGGLDTAQSRSTLELVVQNERDFRVRIAAIQSLGRVGDRMTRQFLGNYLNTLSAQPRSRAYRRLQGPIRGAIRQIDRRYPE